MSTFRVTIHIADLQGQREEPLEVRVDTGATLTKAPPDLLARLGIAPRATRRFRLANNEVVERQVGEATLRIDDRETPDLVVFGEPGEQPLLGARTLEGLFLAVDPVNERLIPIEGLEL